MREMRVRDRRKKGWSITLLGKLDVTKYPTP
jgi:hypothetical protein